MEKLLCTVPEAARALSLSTRSIENMISLKLLASRKIGRRRLVVCADLERMARQGVAVITGSKLQGDTGKAHS